MTGALANAAAGAELALSRDEAHHLHVRRAESGEPIRVVDGRGVVAFGRLELRGKLPVVLIERVERVDAPPPLVLEAGAGDRDRFVWLVEKAAEVGATAIRPVRTAASVSVATRLRDSHHERLERRAVEAAKQCGAAWAMEILPELTVEELAADRTGVRWLADAAGDLPPATLGTDPLRVAVGPEGGFTEAEIALLRAAGYHAVRFAPHVLRFETAAVAAAVAVQLARARSST